MNVVTRLREHSNRYLKYGAKDAHPCAYLETQPVKEERVIKRLFTSFMVFLLCIGLTACNSPLDVEKCGDESIVQVKSEDAEMNLIIDEARKNVNDFLAELNNSKTKGTDFAVKYPFSTDPGSKFTIEHIWLENLEQDNNRFYGTVANDPFYIKSIKIGDRVEFDINKVSDWKYIKDGYLVGGKSIVYFYNKMSDKEKKGFEQEAGFKIKK